MGWTPHDLMAATPAEFTDFYHGWAVATGRMQEPGVTADQVDSLRAAMAEGAEQ